MESNLSSYLRVRGGGGANGYGTTGNGGEAGGMNRSALGVNPASGPANVPTFTAAPFGRPGAAYSNIPLPPSNGGYAPPASNSSPNFNSTHALASDVSRPIPRAPLPLPRTRTSRPDHTQPSPAIPSYSSAAPSSNFNSVRYTPIDPVSLPRLADVSSAAPNVSGPSMSRIPTRTDAINRHQAISSTRTLPNHAFSNNHNHGNDISRFGPPSSTNRSVPTPLSHTNDHYRQFNPHHPHSSSAPTSRSILPHSASRMSPFTRSFSPVPRTIDSAHNVSNESLSIRQMVHVVNALALLRDGTPLMTALAQTVLQRGKLHMPPASQREKILSFKGFGRGITPQTNFLTALSKSDLEILAWIFDVKKNGRKEELARRIIDALTMPLKFIIPHPNRRPHIPHRLEVRYADSPPNNSADNQIGSQPLNHATSDATNSLRHGFSSNPPVVSSHDVRSNMPSFTTSTGALRNNSIQNLARQLEATSPAVVPDLPVVSTAADSSTPTNSRGLSVSRNRKNLLDCHETLKSYNFMEGENEFNEPLNAPLGDDKFVFFTSAQLTRGTEDPLLKFSTPPTITPQTLAKVAGGEVQIHLRCLRYEADKPPSSWKQSWPFPASCRVNGHVVVLNQAQRYTNGKLAGRDAATNISPYLRKHSTNAQKSMNKVLLRRQPSSASPTWGQFVLFAQEILIYSHETVAKNVAEASEAYWQDHYVSLLEKKEMPPSASDFEMAKLGVAHFLNDPDGLMVSSMKVSLRCPLALTRIMTPVKGRKCQHVQCFDLDTYLHFARRSSKFDCPVCNKPTAQPSKLIISPYIQHALKQFVECDEVEITKTGDMIAVERKQTGVASDDEDMEDTGRETNDGNQSSRANNTNNMDVVDLTLDSDDEGDAAGRAPPERSSGVDPFTDVDQEDIDFTFHADTTHYVRTPSQNNNNRDTVRSSNWACDVIAIDSD